VNAFLADSGRLRSPAEEWIFQLFNQILVSDKPGSEIRVSSDTLE
jgi:hypothetical protein